MSDVLATEATVDASASADADAVEDSAQPVVDTPDARPPLPPFCAPPPQPMGEALRQRSDGRLPTVLPDNRAITPAGTEVRVGGFPVDSRVHPTLPVAYIANTGYTDDRRGVQVVSITDGSVVQTVLNPDQFNGIAISPDGTRVYASAGNANGNVTAYRVNAMTGELSRDRSVPVPGYASAITLAPDGSRLWVAQTALHGVAEIDLTTFQVTRSVVLTNEPYAYAITHVPSRNELWVGAISGVAIYVIDLNTFREVARINVGAHPEALVASDDGTKIYVALTNADSIVAVNTNTRMVTTRQPVGEPEISGDGAPLPASNPASLALDSAHNRLYLARSADNAVSVLDPTTLLQRGAIPTGWYPSSVSIARNGTSMVITNAKGFGAGPIASPAEEDRLSGKQRMAGSVEVLDPMAFDIVAGARQVLENTQRPARLSPWDCNGTWPVPTRPGGPTPIEHVVLIVRENKTYDALFGDLNMPQANGDPALTLYGDDVTPNIHSLARQYANFDNFYNDGETSVQGHLWLTGAFVTDFQERTWLDAYRGSNTFNDPDVLTDRSVPSWGTFFSHLIHHNVPFRIFGEVTGSNTYYQEQSVYTHIDVGFPGIFFNTSIPDERKARYVIDRLITQSRLPKFTYVLFPNDHTNGRSAGALTPESMVADNDYATGLLVEAISRSPYWASTAIFILEDDTQSGADHVDYHRGILVIASPWARRGYTSHLHASFPAVLRTIEHMIGVPPINRYDANAPLLYDAFTSEPLMAPVPSLPRRTPNRFNPRIGRYAQLSRGMDFSGPDRNDNLGAMLWASRRGMTLPQGAQAQWSLDELRVQLQRGRLVDDDDNEVPSPEALEERRERADYDRSVQQFITWLRAHPEVQVPEDFRRRWLDRAPLDRANLLTSRTN